MTIRELYRSRMARHHCSASDISHAIRWMALRNGCTVAYAVKRILMQYD